MESEALDGETLKRAVILRLLDVGGGEVYDEAVTKPDYPHYFVHQIGVSDTGERRGRHFLDYTFDIRYRVKGDPSTVQDLSKRLDAAALSLSKAFNVIPCGEGSVRCSGKRCEKEDGVLHFFFSVRVMAGERGAEGARMGSLSLDIGGKR